jgi:hypothetical protein
MDRTLYKPGTLSVLYTPIHLSSLPCGVEKLCLFRTLGGVVFNVAFLFGLATVLPTSGCYFFFQSVANSWILFTLRQHCGQLPFYLDLPQCCQLLAVIYSFSTVLPTPGCYLLFFHSVANSWLLFTLFPQCC